MPRIVDVEARRAALLDVAFALFAERGFEGVSMRDLAQAVGASTGTLYHYFKGKEDLFETLVRHRAEHDVAEAYAGLGGDATPDERSRALAAFLVRRADRLEDTLRVVLDFHRTQAVGVTAPVVASLVRAYHAPLTAAFGEELAGPALSLILGWLVQRMLVPEGPDTAAHVRALAGWTLEAERTGATRG
jgi:AcrR family transcriptional regulator